MDGSKTECLKVTLSDIESQTDTFTQLNAQDNLPTDNSHDADLLLRFSELADRYWNGSKSLLKNQQFKSQHHHDYFCSLVYALCMFWPHGFSFGWLFSYFF